MRARLFWLKTHLYLALVPGAFVGILGMTGSLLVFHPEIDRLIHPVPHATQSGREALCADAIVARVEKEIGSPVGLVRFPEAGSSVFRLELFDPRVEAYRIVDVDARDGALLTNRIWGRTLVTFLFDVHTKLLLGEPGLTIVGVLGIAFLLSIATGIYLWWPRPSAWRRAFTYAAGRGWLPFNFEIHRLTGIYLALVLMVVAAAGVYITLPGPFVAVVEIFANVSAELQDVPSRPTPAAAARMPLQRLERIFRNEVPAGRLTSIVLPRSTHESYLIRFVDRGEPDNFYGQSELWIDQFTGEVLEARGYSRMSSADRFLAMQLPLHDGQYLGLGGRLVVFLGGVATCALYGTGLYLWWKRRRPAARRTPPPRQTDAGAAVETI